MPTARRPTWNPGRRYVANVQLRDGRQLKVPVTVEPPRPQVTLLNKGVQDRAFRDALAGASGQSGRPARGWTPGVFSQVRVSPTNFPRSEKVEVAAVDGSFRTVLSLADASLMLEDAKTAIGMVDPLARFGSSAFGPVQVRAISADGVTGDWLPLGTLVRRARIQGAALPARGGQALHADGNKSLPGRIDRGNAGLRQRAPMCRRTLRVPS